MSDYQSWIDSMVSCLSDVDLIKRINKDVLENLLRNEVNHSELEERIKNYVSSIKQSLKGIEELLSSTQYRIPWITTNSQEFSSEYKYFSGHSPHSMYFIRQASDRFFELQSALSDEFEAGTLEKMTSLPSVGSYVIGDVGISVFRGLVISRQETCVEVLNVDEFETQKLKLGNLYHIKSKFCSIPAQIVECCLVQDESMLNGRWNSEMSCRFTSSLRICDLEVCFTTQLTEILPKYLIKVIGHNTRTSQSVDFNEWVCQRFCTFINDKSNESIAIPKDILDPYFTNLDINVGNNIEIKQPVRDIPQTNTSRINFEENLPTAWCSTLIQPLNSLMFDTCQNVLPNEEVSSVTNEDDVNKFKEYSTPLSSLNLDVIKEFQPSEKSSLSQHSSKESLTSRNTFVGSNQNLQKNNDSEKAFENNSNNKINFEYENMTLGDERSDAVNNVIFKSNGKVLGNENPAFMAEKTIVFNKVKSNSEIREHENDNKKKCITDETNYNGYASNDDPNNDKKYILNVSKSNSESEHSTSCYSKKNGYNNSIKKDNKVDESLTTPNMINSESVLNNRKILNNSFIDNMNTDDVLKSSNDQQLQMVNHLCEMYTNQGFCLDSFCTKIHVRLQKLKNEEHEEDLSGIEFNEPVLLDNHQPQDEMKICKFFAENGHCWKPSCSKEHIPCVKGTF